VAAVVGRVVVAAVGVVGDARKLFPDDSNASGPWMICAKRVTIDLSLRRRRDSWRSRPRYLI
jgi:hypothetical protein